MPYKLTGTTPPPTLDWPTQRCLSMWPFFHIKIAWTKQSQIMTVWLSKMVLAQHFCIVFFTQAPPREKCNAQQNGFGPTFLHSFFYASTPLRREKCNKYDLKRLHTHVFPTPPWFWLPYIIMIGSGGLLLVSVQSPTYLQSQFFSFIDGVWKSR